MISIIPFALRTYAQSCACVKNQWTPLRFYFHELDYCPIKELLSLDYYDPYMLAGYALSHTSLAPFVGKTVFVTECLEV